MAAKRFLDEPDSDPDRPWEKRSRTTRPSFASVIGEAVVVNSLQNLCVALEPLLRRVVNEEVENTLKRCSYPFTKSPSFRIQALEPSSLKLIFSNKIFLPVFTGSKIVDANGAPLQILLIDTSGDQPIPTSLPHPIKVEIVALDGDFPPNNFNKWTSEEFENNIVKERTGRRPLIAGDCLVVTLRDGIAPIGEIELTDNSSWIRSRKFRLGARVSPGSYQGVRIREAMSEAFVVKDHRGELYKKHYPPMLGDEVWRLDKIGKDGAFHRKLSAQGITTVQDFLKLSTVEPHKLKRILGTGMSDRMWESTIKHARTCDLGNKHYILRGPNYTITFNPICQILNATINDQKYSIGDLPNINRTYIESFARQAYANWRSLEEVVGVPSEAALLTQGEQVDQCPTPHQSVVKYFQPTSYPADECIEVGNLAGSSEYNNWQISNSTFHGAQVQSGPGYSLSSESSSLDSELTPRSYINGN